MTRAAVTVVLGLTLCAAHPAGQAPADITGRWVAVSPGAAADYELQISRDKSVMTVVYIRPYAPPDPGANRDLVFHLRETTTYRLDGSTTDADDKAVAFYEDDAKRSTRTLLTDRRVRSTLKREETALVLIDVLNAPGAVRFEHALSVDATGRLIVERRRPVDAVDQEPSFHSARILEPRRIVYERR